MGCRLAADWLTIKQTESIRESHLPLIGWGFIVLAVGMIVGSLMPLRDSAHSMRIPEDKMEKIRKRKAELEAKGD